MKYGTCIIHIFPSPSLYTIFSPVNAHEANLRTNVNAYDG